MMFGKKCLGVLRSGLKSGFGSAVVDIYPAKVLGNIDSYDKVIMGSIEQTDDLSTDKSDYTIKTKELLIEVSGGDSDWAVAAVSPAQGKAMPVGSYVTVIRTKGRFFWLPEETYQLEPENNAAIDTRDFNWTDAPGESCLDDPSAKFYESSVLFVSR